MISQWFAVVRMHRHGRICSLFSNEAQLPKLDVAGSSPVSRSIKLIPNSLVACMAMHKQEFDVQPCESST
jgi:hypothetical protein